MKYYPAFINLQNQKVVVIGGGSVAERKVRTLIKSGARVKVVSPDITSGLARLKEKKIIEHVRRRYRKGDASGAFMVFACTSSRNVNSRVAEEAGELVNVIDMPEAGNFIVPSIISRDSFMIAISTGGASPAISKAVRKELEYHYSREFARYLKFVEQIRSKAMEGIRDSRTRRDFLRGIASPDMLDYLRERGFDATARKISSMLKDLSG